MRREKNSERFHPALSALLLVLIFLCGNPVLAQEDDLNVFTGWFEHSDSPNLLRRHLNAAAFAELSERESKIRNLKSADDWRSRQVEAKTALLEAFGAFPERTPLNARVVGQVAGPGFRAEHIIFESRPALLVTGTLFIPEKVSGKAPAILNVIGHTDIAYRGPSYQRLILNLVRKGFVVFAIDPIGQGERVQYFDPLQGSSLVGGATTEHSYFGKQCFLVGESPGNYFTWDGIRAIDYLLTRPEVDGERIGVTGLSGGGTQTSYISAVDERVKAAAIANYICGFRRLLQSIGPQDGEQNLNLALRRGLDHADFLEVRAPKPTMVISTTRDFFSIQGARETVAEARKAYEALGQPANLSMVEDDYEHGYTKKTREAIYQFFQAHLDNPGDGTDQEVNPVSVEELTVTPTGQLIGSIGGETVSSFIRKKAEHLIEALEKERADLASHLKEVPSKAKEISGLVDQAVPATAVFRGRYPRTGYSIEKYFLEGQGGLVLPFLLFKPDRSPKPKALLYLDPRGKSAEAGPGGEIEWLVAQGFSVLAPDLSGIGELGEAPDYPITFVGVLTGRTLTAIRAAEILQLVRFLQSRPDLEAENVPVIARGGLVTPVVHAAAWERAISRVALVEPFLSFASVALNRYYRVSFADVTPNALTGYDLVDLEASLAPRPLLILNPQDHLLQPAKTSVIDKECAFLRKAYAARQASEKLGIHQWKQSGQLKELLRAWLGD